MAFRNSRQPFAPFKNLYGGAATLQRQQKLCRSAVRDRSSQLTRVRQTPLDHFRSMAKHSTRDNAGLDSVASLKGTI